MIFRIHKHDSGFTQIDNRLLEDERLSWKARGLLAYLLSRPENWRVESNALAEIGPDGRDSVRSGLAELEAHGYLVYTKQQDEKGLWTTVSHVYENPADAAENPQPETENPSSVPPAETDERAGRSEDGLTDVGKPVPKELKTEEQDEKIQTFSHAASQRAPDWGEFASLGEQIEVLAEGVPDSLAAKIRTQLLDPQFWKSVDAVTVGTKVFYDVELKRYVAWLLTKPGTRQHKNLRKGFLSWVKEAIRIDQRKRKAS